MNSPSYLLIMEWTTRDTWTANHLTDVLKYIKMQIKVFPRSKVKVSLLSGSLTITDFTAASASFNHSPAQRLNVSSICPLQETFRRTWCTSWSLGGKDCSHFLFVLRLTANQCCRSSSRWQQLHCVHQLMIDRLKSELWPTGEETQRQSLKISKTSSRLQSDEDDEI